MRDKLGRFMKGHLPTKSCFKKGHPPTKGCFKKGQHSSPKNEFKKGHRPVNWKGDNAKYSAIHYWITFHKGKPQICKHCGATSKNKKLDWANKNHKCHRVLKDYISLCRSCHIKYDLRYNLKPNNKIGTNQYKKHSYKLKRR